MGKNYSLGHFSCTIMSFNIAVSRTIRNTPPMWHVVDAKGQVVGRLATQIGAIIRGKHKPTYLRNADCGDNVVVNKIRAIRSR
jgi:large subunit ribosomal protein L13